MTAKVFYNIYKCVYMCASVTEGKWQPFDPESKTNTFLDGVSWRLQKVQSCSCS